MTATTYTFKLQGWGGEIVLGRVANKVYDYFKDNRIDLAEYANSEKDLQKVPTEFQPFEPSEWFDCDEIAHEWGVEMDDSCVIEVFDDDDNIVWAGNLDAAALEEIGCDVVTGNDIYASDQKVGSVVFYGQQFEKGVFFEGSVETSEPFDVNKLKFVCTDIEGWSICTGVEYDGKIIECEDFDLKQQNNHFAFIKILEDGDTESYTDAEDILHDEDDYDVE